MNFKKMRKNHIAARRILIIIFLAAIVTSIPIVLFLHGQHSLIQPEDLHLNGDGVYFNIFTEDSRGEVVTGTLENVNDDTVLYASIQNAGKNRYMQLTGYLDYQEIPLIFLSEEYNSDNIYLEDGDNIIIPFKLDTDIDPDKNHKFLISLFWGTDLHESDIQLQTNDYSLSYDFFIQNSKSIDCQLDIEYDTSYTFCDLDFPSIMINTDFNEDADGVKLPPSEISVQAGSIVNLAYRIGQIENADSQLLIVTLNYHQTKINNADYLLVNTEASKTAYGTFSLIAPSEKGLYEICALVVPDPTKQNDFSPLENSYRFTLNVI